MANPPLGAPQGALGQASKPPAQKYDPDLAASENIEETTTNAISPVKSLLDVESQREAMNNILLRLRSGLDSRKNQLFDPVMMKAASGFLKPTKTGSFGESLGYAAEGAGEASEKEQARQLEQQKLEAELASKEMEFRQQIGESEFLQNLRPKTNASVQPFSGIPEGEKVALATLPPNTLITPEILQQAANGKFRIDSNFMLQVPKGLRTFFQAQQTSQLKEDEMLQKERLDKRKVVPYSLRTERELNNAEYSEYAKALKEYQATGDDQKLFKYYLSKGWLENEQTRGTLAKEGEPPKPIRRAFSQAELEGEKENATATAKARAIANEALATKLLASAEASSPNTELAKSMIGYTNSNPKVFQIMNEPGIAAALLRASQQGISVGNISVNLPATTIANYKLTEEDLTALQMFAQLNAQLQINSRQLNRVPGEGSYSDMETKLLGAVYALPSDSIKAIQLKSQALIMQGTFDNEKFKLWNSKSKEPGYSYSDFVVDDDYKALKTDFGKSLERMRNSASDLLGSNKGNRANPPAAPVPPASSQGANTKVIPDSTGKKTIWEKVPDPNRPGKFMYQNTGKESK